MMGIIVSNYIYLYINHLKQHNQTKKCTKRVLVSRKPFLNKPPGVNRDGSKINTLPYQTCTTFAQRGKSDKYSVFC
jgi:hypothetical protein